MNHPRLFTAAALLLSLIFASSAFAQGVKKGTGNPPKPPSGTLGDANKQPPNGPPPDIPTGDQGATPGDPTGVPDPDPTGNLERRALETIESVWGLWWERNHESFVRRPLFDNTAHPSLPPHLLDPGWRERRREEQRDSVRQTLETLLEDRDTKVRGAAAVALGLCGPDTASKALTDLLRGPNPRVRDRALLGIVMSGDSPAAYEALRIAAGAPEAVNPLRNKNDVERLRAVAALFIALRQDDPVLPFILDMVQERRLAQSKRALFIMALGVRGSADAIQVLTEIAGRRGEPSLVRVAAVDALGRIGDRSVTDFVLRLLEARDPDPEVRVSAAQAIGHLANGSDRGTVRTLERVLDRDGNVLVRDHLLISLGRMGGTAAQMLLEDRLANNRGEERCFAALGLGILARQQPSSSALTSLLHQYRNSRVLEDRQALLAALGLSAHRIALETLTEAALDGGAPLLRKTAVEALKVLGDPEGIRVLESVLENETTPEVVHAAALALGQLDPVATSHLVRVLSNPKRNTTILRAPLILALGYTRDPQALPILQDLVHTAGITSREKEAATWALGLVYARHNRPLTAPLAFSTNFMRESPEVSVLLALEPLQQ